MIDRPAPVVVPALWLAAVGILLTLAPDVTGADLPGAALTVVGLVATAGAALRGGGAVTVVAAAAVLHLAFLPGPAMWLVFAVAGVLGVYLAAADVVESGAWRAGWRAAIAPRLPAVAAAVAGAGIAILAARPVGSELAATLAVAGTLAAAIALWLSARHPGTDAATPPQRRRRTVQR